MKRFLFIASLMISFFSQAQYTQGEIIQTVRLDTASTFATKWYARSVGGIGGTSMDSTVAATQFRLDSVKANLRTLINARWDSTKTKSYVASQQDSSVFSSSYFAGAGTTASPLYNKKADRADSIQVTEGGYAKFFFTLADTSLNATYAGISYKFKANGVATGGGTTDSLQDLIFTTQTGLSNSSGVWTGTGGSTGAYANFGLASKKLASGQAGYIEMKYSSATDGLDNILAFNTSNTSEGYSPTNYEVGFWFNSADHTVARIDNGVVAGTGVALVLNNIYRSFRDVSGDFKLETSSDHTTWTLVYHYTFSYTGDLFVNINPDLNRKVYNPKIYNGQ